MKNQLALETLLANREYADAFHNYFWLVGQGKKTWAAQYKKVMNKIQKELSK